MPFAALIPTAGRSARMGTAKAWLELDGEPLLQRIVRIAARAGAAACVVVCGVHDLDDETTDQEPEALGEITDPGLEVAGLPRGHLVSRMDVATRIEVPTDARMSVAVADPDGQLIDSIRAGLQLVPAGCDVLLWPVDAPFADVELVRALVTALGTARDRIVVPVVGATRCHPVLFGEAVASVLTSPEADAGAHQVVRKDPSRVITVTARDPRLVQPLNTPDDARAVGIRPGRP